jgi:hypothetical protein
VPLLKGEKKHLLRLDGDEFYGHIVKQGRVRRLRNCLHICWASSRSDGRVLSLSSSF